MRAQFERGRWFWLAVAAANLLWLDGWVAPQVFAQAATEPVESPAAKPEQKTDSTPAMTPDPHPIVSARKQHIAALSTPTPRSPAHDVAVEVPATQAAPTSVISPRTPTTTQPRTTLVEAVARDPDLILYFDLGSHRLSARSRRKVRTLAESMTTSDTLAVVDGHTDRSGKASDNLRLSAQRSQAVISALEAQGVAANRLTSRHFGERRPVSETSRSKNRRVEIVLLAPSDDGAMP